MNTFRRWPVMKEERQELWERGVRPAVPNFSLKINQVWIVKRAATSKKKFHIPFQLLDLDTLLVLSAHSTALITLESDAFVWSSVGIAQSTKELPHPSSHYFLGWLKVNEWLTKDYKGRFSLPQFEATLSSQFQSSTYNLVKSQALQVSFSCCPLLWVHFFFFFTVVPAKRLYNKPPVLRFRVCTKWTWSKMCGILQKNAGWITLND